MATGSCLCGKVKISYSGEPVAQALCHCGDCKKISGGTHSINHVIVSDDFAVTGDPKQFTKTADSGKSIISHFCGDCGSTLFRTGGSFGPAHIVKAGVLDTPGVLEKGKPVSELFAPQRPSWVPAVEGAAQKDGM
ncbi:hypothetical protein P152DRAFT_458588 [Eremomyces bilateralis CBS 781.70]|uniref:CENP-V/GFA domain-containing protein n=1 Tax=Eremomyces bilateralis CBS 781.70 TaxID=1392243 RepID=A0A6G1G246_9PEZI|nr:uncharacterized protein P152DRAFT_458588 [Eremomyces bilateralis CBS 781.70]KAF1812185.1 hypothetical protein P152DRAFT_458588 [Eremomyces bilateralis CBS 781.70]